LAWGLWFNFWLALLTLIGAILAILFSFLDPSRRLAHDLARLWARSLLFVARVPVRVEGLEHLTPGQPYVYAANHRSTFDIFVLLAVLPGKFLWVAKKSLFQIPLFGQAMSRMGYIPVERGNRLQAIRSLNLATERVKTGHSMVIFPEGTRAVTPELLSFKKGVFIMALKAGQPLVPVAISGTRFVQPRGSLRVRPGPVKVVIAPPLHPGDFHDKDELMAAVRQALAANYDPDFPYGPGSTAG